MTSSIEPLRIRRRDPARVEIDWADGHTSVLTSPELRKLCPCALCIHELTGARLLDPASVSDELTQTDLRMVGNYAIAVQFSDGHNTGIYTFPYLREAAPPDLGEAAPPDLGEAAPPGAGESTPTDAD